MESFNATETALVVVDMQNCFAHPDGVLHAPPSTEVVEPIHSFLADARDAGVTVVYTQDTHTTEQFEEDFKHYDEFDRWGEHAVEGSWGHRIVEELQPRDDEYVVTKNTYDAFHNTNLNEYLESNGIEQVLFVGTLANVCVMHSASSAALHDYDSVVVSDLVGYLEESDKEYAINHIEWLFGRTQTADNITFD